MPTVRFQSLYELTVKGVDQQSGQEVVQIYFYRPTLAPGTPAFDASLAGTEMTSALASFLTTYVADVLPHLSSSYLGNYLVLKRVYGWTSVGGNKRLTYGDVATLFFDSGNAQGLRTGDALPAYATLTTQLRTALSGRTRRGSKRYGPVAESDNVNGRITDARFALAQPDFNGHHIFGIDATIAVDESVKMFQCVFSRVLGFATASPWAQTSSFCNDVVLGQLNRNLGSQVSRKPRSDALIAI